MALIYVQGSMPLYFNSNGKQLGQSVKINTRHSIALDGLNMHLGVSNVFYAYNNLSVAKGNRPINPLYGLFKSNKDMIKSLIMQLKFCFCFDKDTSAGFS